MENLIEFDCNLENLNLSKSDIVKVLPNYRSKVFRISFKNSILTIEFLLAATTVEEIKEWLKVYEELTLCSYSVRSTQKCTGRYVLFKQRLYCKRHTRCPRTCTSDVQNRTRNTNCPSSIEFTLRAVKARYQGRNKNLAPNRSMPCVVKLVATHNHSINSPEALKFRDVSDEVKEKLVALFESGHTAASALEILKMEIRQNYENYEEILADRKYCPNYSYCYRLYKTEFRKKYSPTNLNNNLRDFLIQHLNQYNEETKEHSAKAAFPDDSSFVISICPPLCRRIHKLVEAASDMVFLDSSGTLDRDGSQIFILFTQSDCGALPLGVIIISSRSASLLTQGFELLKEMLGEDLFGGNVNGPNIFLINDSSVEQAAVKSFWTNSLCLLHVFYILQSVWKWLLTAENEIEQDDTYTIFEDFKRILYAETIKDCDAEYGRAMENAKGYNNYRQYLKQYWTRRELWTVCYRHNLLTKDDNSVDHADSVMWFIKEKIFERTKGFSLIEMIDFLLTKFMRYYEKRIMDTAYNKARKNLSGVGIKMPPKDITERVQTIADNIFLVPSEKENNLFYIVNSEVLVCTCSHGSAQICKHINWICFIVHSHEYFKKIDSLNVRKRFYEIATGKEPPLDWLSLNSVSFNKRKETEEAEGQLIVLNDIEILKSREESDIEEWLIIPHSTKNETDIEEVIENDMNEVDTYEGEVTDFQFETQDMCKEGKEIVDDLCALLKQMVEESPHEMVDNLKIMMDNALKIQTTSAFASACANFGCS